MRVLIDSLKRLYAAGRLTKEQIAAATGLSAAEIEKL